MLVAPTERPPLTSLGTVSLLPERYGVDVMFIANARKYGCQRKEVKDFVASVHDGRLAKEVAQMQALERAVLCIEGKLKWTLDGELVLDRYTQRWTRDQHTAFLFSVQAAGVWVTGSEDAAGTVEVCRAFERWVKKDKHRALNHRPKPTSQYGRANNRDFQLHLIQGLPGVGIEKAEAILDTLGMPFRWAVGLEELMTVEGIGKVTAERIMRCLNVEEKD